jgi:hypothetical protein
VIKADQIVPPGTHYDDVLWGVKMLGEEMDRFCLEKVSIMAIRLGMIAGALGT